LPRLKPTTVVFLRTIDFNTFFEVAKLDKTRAVAHRETIPQSTQRSQSGHRGNEQIWYFMEIVFSNPLRVSSVLLCVLCGWRSPSP
jgi:hypothetical protein